MTLDISILWDILFSLLFIVFLLLIASFFIIRDIRREYLKVYRVKSKFDIDLRKLVNLISNMLDSEKLQAFQSVVIKQLPHEQKKILLKNIDAIIAETEDNEENKYIFETYQKLQESRRIRDSKVLIFNNKLMMFPYNFYSRFMKLKKFELYTTNE